MTRPVTLIAIGGIVTALVCLPLAATLQHHADGFWGGWSGSWPDNLRWFGDDDSDSNGVAGDNSAGNGAQIVSRDFSWSGGNRLELDLPGTVHFQPAPEWHLSIKGRTRTLDHLIVDGGRIRLRRSYHRGAGALDVQLSGPLLRHVTLNGSGNLVLDGLKQDSLSIEIHGSGSARASGSVDTLRVDIMGSGSALLTPLAVRSATIAIAGSGAADISPSDAADIFIAGSGDVHLHSHPRQLKSRVAGSGQVVEMPGDPGTGNQTT